MSTSTDVLQEALDRLLGMTSFLLEAHMDEMSCESNHGDDADHEGEAPEVCSYCRAIVNARKFLQAQGVEVHEIVWEGAHS